MADTRSTGRIKKYGVCLNDKCEKYKQIQEVLHGDLECPECKKKLSPCAPPKKKSNKKLPLVIVGIIVAIAIIVGLFFAFFNGSNEEQQLVVTDTIPEIDTTSVATEVVEPDTVVLRDTIVVRDTIVQNNTVTTNEKVTTKTIVSSNSSSQPKAAGSSNGTIRLSYGKYSGNSQAGKPHGQGRLTFTTSHLIDERDPKGRVAEPGDYVIGEWNSGNLVQGRWYGSDGNVKGSIIIGM